MKSCEFVLYDCKPTGKGKDRVWPKCGKKATHLWLPRTAAMPVCEYHGRGLAGNFLDELEEISSAPAEVSKPSNPDGRRVGT